MKLLSRFRLFLTISAVLLIFSGPLHADTEFPYQPWIRVAVVTDVHSINISTAGTSYLNSLESTESQGSYEGNHTYSFDISDGRVRLTGSGGMTCDGFSIICDDETGRIQVNGKSYRRIVRVVIWNGSLACVNVLPMEEYLWGVVPCEIPPDWPVESLRAQAIAARTYALRAFEQYPDRPFDVYSSVVDQVYRGSGSERETTTQACMDTCGQVCTYNDTPIVAYYHAASGGWTASGADTFGRDLPYLRPVPSRDSSVIRWTYPVTASNLASALRSEGYTLGNIQRVWVQRFSPEGRAEEIKIVHSDGVLLIGGVELRHVLGPGNIQSTYFTVQGQDPPDIPDGTDFVPTQIPGHGANPGEMYANTHPDVYVPVSEPSRIGDNPVLTADGVESLSRFFVLGSSGVREYVSGYVWIASPVLAGEMGRYTNEIFFPGPCREADLPAGTQVVDDPGGTIGNPQNGSFVFVGHGCGHGVGMSQHGARVLAESGWTFESILKYFYTGVEIERYW